MAKSSYIWDSELTAEEMDELLKENTLPLDSPFTAQGFVLDHYKDAIDGQHYNMVQLPRTSKRLLMNTYFHLRLEPSPKGCRLWMKKLTNVGHITTVFLMAWPLINGIYFIRQESFSMTPLGIFLLLIFPAIFVPLMLAGQKFSNESLASARTFLSGLIGSNSYTFRE